MKISTIKRRRDILKTKQIKQRVNNRYLNISYEKSENFAVLFVVTKKNFPKSVQRNRIKRQIREILRAYEVLYCLPSYHLVFFCKQDMKLVSYSTISENIFSILDRIKSNKV